MLTFAGLASYDAHGLAAALDDRRNVEILFAQALARHPNRTLIRAVVYGVRPQNIEGPTRPEKRYLNKLVDEQARERNLKVP